MCWNKQVKQGISVSMFNLLNTSYLTIASFRESIVNSE
jgi:hypothetical protein